MSINENYNDFSKQELVNITLDINKLINTLQTKKDKKSTHPIPIPKPLKSVIQMVKNYEDNIIVPPLEFRDDYKTIPKPSSKKQVIKKPVPLPRTIIRGGEW